LDQLVANKGTLETAFRKWRVRGFSINYTPMDRDNLSMPMGNWTIDRSNLGKSGDNGYIELCIDRLVSSRDQLLALGAASKDIPDPFGAYFTEIKAQMLPDGSCCILYKFKMSATFFQQALLQAYNDAFEEAFTETLEEELVK
jgi:hypothetical protein